MNEASGRDGMEEGRGEGDREKAPTTRDEKLYTRHG